MCCISYRLTSSTFGRCVDCIFPVVSRLQKFLWFGCNSCWMGYWLEGPFGCNSLSLLAIVRSLSSRVVSRRSEEKTLELKLRDIVDRGTMMKWISVYWIVWSLKNPRSARICSCVFDVIVCGTEEAVDLLGDHQNLRRRFASFAFVFPDFVVQVQEK